MLRKGKEKPVKKFREKLTEALDMPSDVVLDTPKVTIMSNNNITIENYNGIVIYSDILIKIKTKEKIIAISGERMIICVITDNYIMIEGIISNVGWE